MFHAFSKIEVLKLESGIISNYDDAISKMPALKELSLKFVNFESLDADFMTNLIDGCKNIEHLEFCHCFGLKDLTGIGRFSKLKSLEVLGYLIKFPNSFWPRNLHKFSIGNYIKFDEVQLRSLADCCPDLKSISIADISDADEVSLSSSSMTHLLDKCQKLRLN